MFEKFHKGRVGRVNLLNIKLFTKEWIHYFPTKVLFFNLRGGGRLGRIKQGPTIVYSRHLSQKKIQ